MRRFEHDGYGEFALTKREEAAITKAFAEIARMGSLRADQRSLIDRFAGLWFTGEQLNFDQGKLGHAFLDLCAALKVPVQFMKKVGNEGPMEEREFRDVLAFF